MDDLQNVDRAAFNADAAGDAFGSCRGIRRLDNDAERADLFALAAACAELFVDHVDAGGILCDGAGLADLGTLAALDANHRLGNAVFIDDLDAGFVETKFLVKRLGARANTAQAGHAG